MSLVWLNNQPFSSNGDGIWTFAAPAGEKERHLCDLRAASTWPGAQVLAKFIKARIAPIFPEPPSPTIRARRPPLLSDSPSFRSQASVRLDL
uniref:Uncharacterized protein n=1 Tax=Coccidioides posadasii RMSCC 3488 TaxID=454284 RepID=A0A0J6F1T3_COCPO|nr:hypothetical protein CPAG_03173 [Coccidioides posadasii RMSCC 3488]